MDSIFPFFAGFFLLLVFLFFASHTVALALAALIVALPNRTFLRAFGCSLLVGVGGAIILFPCMLAGPVGVLLALVVVLILSAAVISGIYRSGFGPAFGAAAISLLLAGVFCVAGTVLTTTFITVLGQSITGQFNNASRTISEAGNR